MAHRLAMTAFLALAISNSAMASPAYDVTTDYYSDSGRTHWVGSFELTCGGGRISFGKVTKFSKKTKDSCAQHRIDSTTLKSRLRPGQDPLQVCLDRCSKKFAHADPCTPESCPSAEAKQACETDCNASYSPNPANMPR